MKRAFLPLYLKILAWFFLNLVLLSGVFVLLFQAQFRLNLDWLLAAGARERLDAVRGLIVGELNAAPPDEWGQVLDRFSAAYHVRFALFDDEANPLVGQVSELPEEVRKRVLEEPVHPSARDPAAEAGASGRREPSRRSRRHFPVRIILRTTNPVQYWLLASSRIDNPQAGDPMRVVLAASSNSISAGGLIFNPIPWIELGLGAVVFSLLFWLPLVRGITRAVGQMTHATRQIADGRFDVRLSTRRRDELGSLAASINEMAGRLDGFVQGQKRFLGDIAHELCSPLARLQLALGILEQRAGGEHGEFVRSAAEKADQISALVGELLSFSKASFGASAVRLQPVNVRDAAKEAVRREAAEGAQASVEIPPDLCVAADPDLLIRALANLVRNAFRHAVRGGPIALRAVAAGGEAFISVIDNGPGVPEEELPKIFEPFYRVDPSRTRATGNVGLGLTIVKACVQSCCGTVAARNLQPHGFEVQIRLPIAAK